MAPHLSPDYRVALITGASSEIGKATATVLAQGGLCSDSIGAARELIASFTV